MTSRRSESEAADERLFLALVPPAELAASLHAQAAERLEAIRSDLSSSLAAKLHVTLRFYGELAAGIADELEQDLRDRLRASHAPRLTLTSTGTFGGERPRVLWLGIDDDTGHLGELARLAERSATSVGLDPEPRAFRPHLTLARIRKARSDRPLALPEAFRTWRPNVRWQPDRAMLVRTLPTGSGMAYEDRASFPLLP